jgi:hypothetical protein
MADMKCPDCHIGTIVNGLCDNCNLSLEDIETAADFADRFGIHGSTPTNVVTGVLTDGRRFKAMRFRNKMHAMMINLYRGSVWEEKNGRRTLIKRVYN